MGFLELLTIIFIVLKLTGVIAWSWWIVLLPMIIAAAIYAMIFAVWLTVFIKGVRESKKLDKEMKDMDRRFREKRTIHNR